MPGASDAVWVEVVRVCYIHYLFVRSARPCGRPVCLLSAVCCGGFVTSSRAPLRLGGVRDTSLDRGFWVTQAGALPASLASRTYADWGGLFLLVVLVLSCEGVLKVGFGFGSLSCPRVCVCISVDAFALVLVGAC